MAKQRSPEQIEADRVRMEKVRAARNTVTPVAPEETVTPDPVPEQIVGAALSVADSDIKSMLEGINEDSEVEIYNPLNQGFRVQFATSAYQSPSLTTTDREVRDKALLPYEKDGGQSQGHAVKFTVLPAHKVTKLPGKVAHVAIKQLRNYLIGIENPGKGGKSVADPVVQREYEDRIVMRISSSLDGMNQIDPGAEIDRKIAELNPVNG